MTGFDLTREERESLRIFQPRRAVVGFCPTCARMLVIHNDGEVWPPVLCECGWGGGTTDLLGRRRFESMCWRDDLPLAERFEMKGF